MAWIVKYTQRYQQDYENALEHLVVEHNAIHAAEELTKKMRQAHDSLALFPLAHPVHQLSQELEKEYRVCPVKPYNIIYLVDGDSVILARLLHSRQDFGLRMR